MASKSRQKVRRAHKSVGLFGQKVVSDEKPVVRSGRPSKQITCRLYVRVPKVTLEQLEELSSSCGGNVSETVRTLVAKAFERLPKQRPLFK